MTLVTEGYGLICFGCDPGKSGAISGVDMDSDKVFLCRPLPTDNMRLFSVYMQKFANRQDVRFFLEKPQSMPKNSAVAMLSYGMGCGVIEGVLIAHKVPYVYIRPNTWTKTMHLGTKDGDPKERSLEACLRLFPGILIPPMGPRSRGLHDGCIDSLLIMEFGRRQLLGGQALSA